MQGDLKLCPLCGSVATEVTKGISACCSNDNCVLCEPMDINEWQSRPVEDALIKQLDRANLVTNNLLELSTLVDHKFVRIKDILGKIAEMEVTIILKDGTVINSGELARDGIDTIMN